MNVVDYRTPDFVTAFPILNYLQISPEPLVFSSFVQHKITQFYSKIISKNIHWKKASTRRLFFPEKFSLR